MGLTYATAVGVGCIFSAILKKIIRKPRPPSLLDIKLNI